jgi:4-amino-4-deoxy-L-arabinose transferase-like glycosyltransferase
VVALALLVRIVVILASPHFAPLTDAAEYDRAAVSLVRHGVFAKSVATYHGGATAIHPPGFSVALATVYRVVGTGSASTRWAWGRVLEACLGAIAVGLICVIALRLWGSITALTAGVVSAVFPPLLLIGSTLLAEPLFIVFELAAVLAALIHRDSPHRYRWAVATGVLVSLGALTRGNGLVLAIPLLFLVWSERPRLTRRAVAAPAAFVAAAVLTLVPWTIRNFEAFHQFVPITTETGFVLAGAYQHIAQDNPRYASFWLPPFAAIARLDRTQPKVNEAQMSDHLVTVAFDYIRAHPGALPKTAYWNTLRLLNLAGPGFERWFAADESYPRALATVSVYGFWVLLALTVPGLLVGVVRRRARQAPAAFWWCPVVTIAVAIPLEGSTRYRSPADPFLLMFAAVTLTAAAEWLRQRRAASQPLVAAGAGR